MVPAATGKKKHPFTRLWLAPGAPAAVGGDALAVALPPNGWQMAQIQDGSKGPLVAEVVFVRAVAVPDRLPGPDVWVVLRHALDASRELKTSLCNAAADTPPVTLVWLLGLRWWVEQAIKEAKEELGLDHYEVRSWRGWHHHTTMPPLAQHFLCHAPRPAIPRSRPTIRSMPFALVQILRKKAVQQGIGHRARATRETI